MDWEQLFASSSAELKAALDKTRASFQHRGLKGTLNENAFAEWLRSYLPRTLDVSAGELIDSLGGRSRQVDVVIYDAATTPRFLSREGISVIPIEPVYGVIEVKTYLNKQEIENSFENMSSIKSLQKLAYHKASVITNTFRLYGVENAHWPVQFYIFAYESDGLDTVLSHVSRLNNSRPLHQQIDGVCVLDKGLVLHSGPTGIQPVPMPNTTMGFKESSKALLTFYTLIAHTYGQAVTERFSIHHYLAHIKH